MAEISWDEYFMEMAKAAARKCHCYSRQAGAVITRGKFGPISTGYNGPPIGISHCEARHPQGKKECPRRPAGYASGEGLHMCPAAHAEQNAIVLAARRGVAVEGDTLYLYDPRGLFPCKNCAIDIIQAGIKEVVVLSLEEYDKGLKDALKASDLFKEAGIKVREFLGRASSY